ncbi:MAG: hypothetical protein JWP79_670 [Polaromonas sp.]|jgi:hypothetical protein|nr:hypothetical protein [Polaromonas sp.]
MYSKVQSRATHLGLTALCISILYGCGGGGDNGASVATPDPVTPSGPVLAAATTLADGTSVGTPTFPKGATATGGVGQDVLGLACEKPVKSSPAYGYSHLNLVVDGKQIAIPEDIGQVAQGSAGIVDPATRSIGCFYPLTTTDTSGKIRIKPGSATPYTLGQFFALWGQPLSTTNVAGYAGKTVKAFIRDGATLTEYTGALDALPLTGNREITLQVGTALSEIPNFAWTNPPALSATPVIVNRGAFGAAVNGQLGLEDNRSNGRGGQGEPVDGLSCYGPRNQSNLDYIYHAHSHLAIYKDGVRLAIPQLVGVVGNDDVPSTTCFYPLHTHDMTGTLHIEPLNNDRLTLGQFFSIWGQPLTRTNVAGQLNTPVVIYVRDGGNLRVYQGDPAAIELKSYRSIVIQMGTPLAEVPTFELASEAN